MFEFLVTLHFSEFGPSDRSETVYTDSEKSAVEACMDKMEVGEENYLVSVDVVMV